MKKPDVDAGGWLELVSLLAEEPHTIQCQVDKVQIYSAWYYEVFEFPVVPEGRGQLFDGTLLNLKALKPRTYYRILVEAPCGMMNVQIEQAAPEPPGVLW